MQVEARFFSRRRFAVSALACICGLMLAAVSGCHRGVAADVMATVNGKQIKRAELDKAYKNYLASMGQGQSPQTPSPEQADIIRLNILHQMIQDEILQQRAAKLHLAASDEDVNSKLTEMKAPYTEEEFARQLKQRDLTLDDLKHDLRRSLTQERLLNKEIESKINITDADISSYYKAHKSEFNLIEPMYHLAQIVVTTAPTQQTANLQNNKASGDADARKKIQILHNRLQSGEDFGAVAMSFSENPNNASNGGDMGFVAESALRSDPAAYDAISKLKPGQITDVLPLYDSSSSHRVAGYAIYKLIAREPAGQRTMNDPRVQQRIRQYLRGTRAQLLKNAYFEMLHDQAKVRNYYAEQILKNGGTE